MNYLSSGSLLSGERQPIGRTTPLLLKKRLICVHKMLYLRLWKIVPTNWTTRWLFEKWGTLSAEQAVQERWFACYTGRGRIPTNGYGVLFHRWLSWRRDRTRYWKRLTKINMLYSELISDVCSDRRMSGANNEGIDGLKNVQESKMKTLALHKNCCDSELFKMEFHFLNYLFKNLTEFHHGVVLGEAFMNTSTSFKRPNRK